VTKWQGKFHNEEFHNFCVSPVIMMMWSRRVDCAGLVLCIWRSEMRIPFRLESLKERDHSEDLYLHGKIILKWILIV
jgi:hypothetical protein